MKIRMRRLMLMLALLPFLLCGCTSDGIPLQTDTPTVTLPPAATSHVAPIGDAALEYAADATLYLPRHDGMRLSAVTAQVTFSASRPHAESLVRALLNHTGDGVVSQLGGSVRLSLYGVNPVEVSRDVVTVNLGASALQLDREALYLACQAITNTLTELSDINYVNVLVVDKPVGLDIANTLPMGTLSRSTEQDISAAYEQLLSRRVSSTESAEEKSLLANATLYFALPGTGGVVSETRSVSFGNQVFSSMAVTLLRELAAGPQQGIGSPALPLLADLLAEEPEIITSAAAGGQVMSLAFTYNLDDMLESYGLTRAECMSSLCYTLCSFFPNLAGISVTIGDERVEALDASASLTFESGVQRRSDYAYALMDYCTLYFGDEETGRLAATQRPVSYSQRMNPRTLLAQLALGPQPSDTVQGLSPIMAENAIVSADVLGLALSDGTLLVNLSTSFLQVGAGMDAEAERRLAYAIVNTLCEDARVRSVCVFISGSQFDGFSGEIYWRGLFYPMVV